MRATLGPRTQLKPAIQYDAMSLFSARFAQRKLLYTSPVRRFSRIDVALQIDSQVVDTRELAHLAASVAERSHNFQVLSPQDPDLVVVAVPEIQIRLLRIDRETNRERGPIPQRP